VAKIEVKVPDIGDFKDVPIIEILVKPGDSVKAEQSLVTLESDKATMDVPAPASGVVGEILAKIGDKVSMGTALLTLDEEGAAAAPAPAAPAPAAPAPAPTSAPADAAAPSEIKEPEKVAAAPASASAQAAGPNPAVADFSGVNAGPAVRRLARELGIDLTTIKGTGDKGRITREDVKAALSRGGAGAVSRGGAALPEIPAVDFAKFGPVETVPLSRIKRISGPRLHASWVNVPHVTHSDEADVTDLETFRKSLDDAAKSDKKAPYRVSLLPLLMKASVASLKAFPTFNSALAPAKDALIFRRYWHLGVAVDTPEGLVVAVVRDVDQKGVLDLARELGALSAKARDGKLSPAEMQGATFTISSLGGIGGTAFTPIVNAPEVAILGVVRSKMAPVWDGEAFQPRLMLPLCLSYDHRVIDGAAGARFMRHLCSTIEDMRRVLL
jgi:pyruvate dehydrogenase E2 component (dihydrolipoamide acetyltransferase)